MTFYKFPILDNWELLSILRPTNAGERLWLNFLHVCDEEVTLFKRTTDKVIQTCILPELFSEENSSPAWRMGGLPIQGHVLTMVLNPIFTTLRFFFMFHSIKLSAESKVYRGKLQVLRSIHSLLPLHT